MDLRWTSPGGTNEEENENETELIFKLSKSPDSAPEWDCAETLCQLLFPDLTVWNIRRNKVRTKTKDQRIVIFFHLDKKIHLFYRIECSVSKNKILKIRISWSELAFKVNLRIHKPHLFFS